MNVDEAVQVIRRDAAEFVGGDLERVAATMAETAETIEAFKAQRRSLEATLRTEHGMSDADVRRVRRAVYGEYDDALLRLRRAVS